MYTENELENYAHYIDFIKKCIVDENKDIDLKEREISINNIDKVTTMKDGKFSIDDIWGFNYEIKNKYKGNPEIWKGRPYLRRYLEQISFYEWRRLQKIETRDKLIDNILDGLEPKHKITLIEGLKINEMK